MDDNVHALHHKIQELQTELEFYKTHHQFCTIQRQPSPPPDNPRCDGPFRFIEFHPGLDRKSTEPERKVTDQKYQNALCSFLKAVPDASAWIKAKNTFGLPHESIILYILGVFPTFRVNIETPPQLLSISATNVPDLITLASQFALLTKRSSCRADISSLLMNYQEIVLASFCAVLENCGVDVNHVNSVMRIYISNSSDENLNNLRLTAIWLNKTIVKLNATGLWNHRAGEVFFLCGFPTSKYVRLWKSKCSYDDIVKQLSDPKYFSEEINNLENTPLLIPAFIKIIVRDELTLEQICTPLGYPSIDEINDTLDRYIAILENSKKATRATSKKRKLADHQVPALDWHPITFPEDLEWERVYFDRRDDAGDIQGDTSVDPYMGAMDNEAVTM